MKVLVTGATGQLGAAVAARLPHAGYDVIPLGRTECDLARPDHIAALADYTPDVIVNCAAWTDVDGAESHPLEAADVNAIALSRLAKVSASTGARLVHISTDFVFQGDINRPLTEDDVPRPRGTYALTKLLGEWLALDAPRALVLRVESLFGGTRAKSSIDRIIDGLCSGAAVKTFSDRTVSPTYTLDAVDAIAALLHGDAPGGVYHCVNSGWTTWEGVGREILRLTGAPGSAEAVLMASVTMQVPRPLYCALSNQKLAQAGFTMPGWQDALRRHLAVRGLLATRP